MRKRILKTLTIALAIGIFYPLGSAAGKTMSEVSSGLVSAKQSSASVVSEISSGLVPAKQSSSTVVSEKTAGLGLSSQSELAVSSSSPVVSEKAAGFSLPSEPETVVMVSTGTGFDWGDAGIGAGVVSVSLLAAFGLALALRRRQGTFAH
jgi:hypothetical protein